MPSVPLCFLLVISHEECHLFGHARGEWRLRVTDWHWSWSASQAGARRFRREAYQNKYPLRKMCRRIGAVGVSSTIAGVPLYFACFLLRILELRHATSKCRTLLTTSSG